MVRVGRDYVFFFFFKQGAFIKICVFGPPYFFLCACVILFFLNADLQAELLVFIVWFAFVRGGVGGVSSLACQN